MKAKPVRSIPPPKYPTRLEVLQSPDLLHKHMPVAWKYLAKTTGAVGMMLMMNNYVLAGEESPNSPPTKHAVVAPIFTHGEGRATTGCVVVNPPVFLSEQDALQVIREEMQRAGVDIFDDTVQLDEISVPQSEEYWEDGQWKSSIVPSDSPVPLRVRMARTRQRVAFNYVDAHHYFQLGGPRSPSTVQNWDFKGVADSLTKLVERDGHDVYFGAFYEPGLSTGIHQVELVTSPLPWSLSHPSDSKTDQDHPRAETDRIHHQETTADLRTEAKRLLRQQVHDFMNWLKAQGII